MFRYTTAGESHGKGLVGIIEGMPSGLPITSEYINKQLKRRQQGYGRGGRMKIESDSVDIISGVRGGVTTGSPISFLIHNKDYENWQEVMDADEIVKGLKEVKRPRPGHADLPGAIKFNHLDMRNILERASARETAARVAVGAFCRKLLEYFNIYIYSQVLSIGEVSTLPKIVNKENYQMFCDEIETSIVRCADKECEKKMVECIDKAKNAGESLGGSFEIGVIGVPVGLGSHVSWENRLDSQLAALIMGIPAIKSVEIGEGIENSKSLGSYVHDEIFYNDTTGLYRKTNRSGGIEGGISNGETINIKAYMKPIPTLYKPLTSVNISNWKEEKADIERSDICAVPAASIVGEAMLAFGITKAYIDKFGGDSIVEVEKNYYNYKDYMKKVWKWEKI
ncbi:Chorismate synthase [Candidatus Syntrophocurvum alkaliphilum]|uniref:Chorismate synthase n=1 Tax=Candidatus Syntrophocurvum alkaliphilum TaxID=2293317 RepID=A0A6I6DCS5_9FIRM|nr:chorismate synthase [Candidatus Syntrophocurvum alkaliphilum]QGT98930.1 Chorismate synthase [Candidatus Syntrophocurvum alkaliphilum]